MESQEARPIEAGLHLLLTFATQLPQECRLLSLY